MGSPGFVHLHTHSEFSLLDGACRIEELVAKAVEFGMPAIALTDHGAMYGNISFYHAATAAGLKPILGCEVYVAPRSLNDKDPRLDRDQHHLVLLAVNENGYRNLIKLVSIANSEGLYYKPRVDREVLSEYSADLIAMTACLSGEVPKMILAGDMERARQALGEYVDIFGRENVYVELQDNGLADQKKANPTLIALAREAGLKLAATNDIHYLRREDAQAHDILLCIQTNSTLADPNRMRFGSDEFYMKSPEEMVHLFAEVPEAIASTLEIAERCNVSFDFSGSKLPDPGIPEGKSAELHMQEQAEAGLRARLGGELPSTYRERLDYECRIINQCGFARYMLIVRDFTDFARKRGICVGVRGSAAGSLVCYGLGITDVDPVEYGLTFERFLNPERIEMPDVDLDIQDDRRDELIQYVSEKYGRDRVGQIATFNSLKARAAVRDCGRVLGMDPEDVNRTAKMIPTIPVNITIDRALEENRELQTAYNTRPDIKRLIDTARKLEGLNRNIGVHAAGVLISEDPLTDHVPVQFGNRGEIVAQLAKKDVARVGLLKMDFLGLANLTILAKAVDNVRRHRGLDIDVFNIPLEDPKTFEMLGRGDTTGVFQLEGPGMRRNVVELKPNSVRELAAIVALYRPGPMAHIPKFVRSKFGQEPITYLHPRLEPILEETYGVICYQDQVLRIAQAIAGFTLGQADVLRKAMSVKDRATMDKQRQKFIDGARASGVPESIAAKIFEQIEPFAGYAFNKAHAVCYAFLAYRTAYMKANYPVEFYAPLLSANMDDKEKLALYLADCRRLGVRVLPPDVNFSGLEFQVEDGCIRFGLGAIKGCGHSIIEGIVAARQAGGRFLDLADFCCRVQEQVTLNRSTVECLIRAGAFSSVSENRAQLLEMLPDALNYAACLKRDQANGQAGLFDGDHGDNCPVVDPARYSHISEFAHEDLLKMEKELVGVYLSGHPLDSCRATLERRCTATAGSYTDLQQDEECVIGGIVADIQIRQTRRGDRMARVRIEDLHGTIPVTFFPSAFRNCERHLIIDSIVLITGKAAHREPLAADEGETRLEVEIIGESVSPLTNGASGADVLAPRTVHIRINGLPKINLEVLRQVLEAHPGSSPVYFWMLHCGTRKRVATQFSVDPTARFVADVEGVLGRGSVKVA